MNRNRERSALSRRILFEYLLTLIGTIALFFLLVFLARIICGQFIWQPDDPIYQLLQWVKDNLLWICSIIVLALFIGITYLFIRRPLLYLDEMIAASKRLAAPTDEPIVLAKPMKSVEDELNLVREQALRSRYLAKEAEQRKNDLIVYLAHDLKTPLTSVIGYLNLLCDEPQISPELRARYTGIALDKALRLEDLINEFFDITRFNLSSITIEPERINLSRMLEQIIFEFQPVLAEKQLTFRSEIAPNISIVCDPGKLARVFDNLVRNAVGYSYENSEIFLSMQEHADTVTILLKNHGKTIPPEKLTHLFEQFYRVDASRSSKTGGAGLGLAIAKEIVSLHGGTISAASEQESICFCVTLLKDCQKIV